MLHVEHWGSSLPDVCLCWSRLFEFFPKSSSFFLPDTLLYQGYGICTGQWTYLQEFVAHSELLIERLHLVCFLFCSKFPKIHIYRNIMSFPVFRIITALFASFCNNRDLSSDFLFHALDLLWGVKPVLPAELLKLYIPIELSDVLY